MFNKLKMRNLLLLLLFTVCVSSIPCEPSASLVVGIYSPQCNDDGSWKKLQCHGSTGFCWCVDKEGKRLKQPFRPWLSAVALEDQCL